ncbi:UDP-3-O-(3-hydroxymyristoyl)glucosamine N-acyltransferase, partial [Candidatus Pelagibacter sp.]|nr:UDP-3-O-(3-hydroxymyristoyl)glucosamine N-acyltransferase [Candidatus Pelagibacter sp.]
MMNPFFKKYGPVNIKEIYKILEIKRNSLNKETKIFDITDLNSASNKDITFFHSNKYKSQASITKAAACITTKNLQYVL